ncbi:MAG: matrixin family metalloprotease [Planctomycetes bacterium]|nr:matrixin family metalloprotease [Planctomycetota bacterium]
MTGVFAAGWAWVLPGDTENAAVEKSGYTSHVIEPTVDTPTAEPNEAMVRRLRDRLETQLFKMLPPAHQEAITRGQRVASERIGDDAVCEDAARQSSIDEDASDDVALAMMSPFHRKLYRNILAQRQAGEILPSLCFAPDTRPEIVEAFSLALGLDGSRAQLTGRWSTTATDGGGLTQGTPTILTYSFVPDGTFVPELLQGISGNSDLNAFFNGIYGNPATWQPLFDEVFTRWSEVSGLNYVLEPNDDGSDLNGLPGVIGVRGDLRIAGIFIDGNSGTLAYNNFPEDGDMVLDTGDNFFADTSGNSLRLRNIIAHEHGHGLGLFHVCPLESTKLMEPFINLNFDGPQHDEVRGSQRHYGDPFEPDNSSATANDLGVLTIGVPVVVGTIPPPTVISNGSTLSIDANGEQDFFRVTVNGAAGLDVSVTPLGLNYDDSPQACFGQPGSCCSGSFTNSLTIANLDVEVIDQNGSSVLATGNSAGAGSIESLNGVVLPLAGDYFVRVFESNSPSEAQLYTLTVTATAPPFVPVTISLPSGAPTQLTPGMPENFDVQIIPGDEILTPGSETLHYRYDGGVFLTAALVDNGGNQYTATLPAPACVDMPEFYISAVGDQSGQVTLPALGAAAPFTAIVGTPFGFSDDFEADLGWTVSGDAADGPWDRGVPVNFNRGDPVTDFDGSGSCYLTDNDAGNSNSDVDDGTTILTSPVIDMAQGGTISYAYWFNDIAGGPLNGDALTVEVATDAAGTNWVQLRNYTTAAAAWLTDSIDVGTEVAASATIRVRFSASDLGTQNVVEAGIDAFATDGGVDCTDAATCADGVLNQGEDRIDCGGPCPACTCTGDGACDDLTFCNGAETCDAFGECQAGTDPCVGQSCRESDGVCLNFGDGDFDLDADVDLADFLGMQQCFGSEASGACTTVNMTGDAQIDLNDFAAFVSAMTGP